MAAGMRGACDLRKFRAVAFRLMSTYPDIEKKLVQLYIYWKKS